MMHKQQCQKKADNRTWQQCDYNHHRAWRPRLSRGCSAGMEQSATRYLCLVSAPHFWHFRGRPNLTFASHTANSALSVQTISTHLNELYNSFAYKLCKVPPQPCDRSTITLTFLVVLVLELLSIKASMHYLQLNTMLLSYWDEWRQNKEHWAVAFSNVLTPIDKLCQIQQEEVFYTCISILCPKKVVHRTHGDNFVNS